MCTVGPDSGDIFVYGRHHCLKSDIGARVSGERKVCFRGGTATKLWHRQPKDRTIFRAQREDSVLLDRGQRGIFERSGQWTFQLGLRAGDLSEWCKCMRDGVGRKFIGVKRSIRSRHDQDDRETPADRGAVTSSR